MTAGDLGILAGVSSRTARGWTTKPGDPGHRPLPYSAWILAQLCIGTLTLEEYKVVCAERTEQKKEWEQRGWEQ